MYANSPDLWEVETVFDRPSAQQSDKNIYSCCKTNENAKMSEWFIEEQTIRELFVSSPLNLNVITRA